MNAAELVGSLLTEQGLLPFLPSPDKRRDQTCKELATLGRNEKQGDSESR